MKAVLATEIDDNIVVTLTLTKAELAEAAGNPQLLAQIIRRAYEEGSAAAETGKSEERCEKMTAAEETTSGQIKAAEFVLHGYKNLPVRDIFPGGTEYMTREDVITRVIDWLISQHDVPVSMNEVEEETEFTLMSTMQSMRYDIMFGRAPAQQIDPDELREEIRRDLIREQKEERILGSIIEQERFTVSPQELLEEAEAMAARQDTSIEMVRSFFGEDLHGLAGDVKKQKAKKLLYAQCVDAAGHLQ